MSMRAEDALSTIGVHWIRSRALRAIREQGRGSHEVDSLERAIVRVRYRPEVDHSWLFVRPEKFIEGVIDRVSGGETALVWPGRPGQLTNLGYGALIEGVHPRHVRVFSRVMWSAMMNTHPKALSRVPKLRADWEIAESNIKAD